MKKLILFIFALWSIGFAQAQTTVFLEDFEGSTLSMTSSSTGTNAWGLNTLVYAQGAKSDSCVVTAGDTTYLTSNSFSTLGNSYVMLNFAQICKIAFTDKGIIEVSIDGGSTWTQLAAAQYLGTGQFGTNTNSFNDVSYLTDWAPFVNTIPDNSWWKNELFDISSIAANKASVKVRFSLIDGGTAGSEGRYGWLLDNVKVIASTTELVPPTITYVAPILKDSVYNQGPFDIKATISDASGIDTAILIYSKNGGTEDTVGMSHAGNLYIGTIDTIPAFAIGDTVCYRVVATDASASANVASNPAIGCTQFIIKVSPPPPGCTTPISSFPYIEDFTSAVAGTGTPSSPGTLPTGWTRTPASGSSVYMHLVKTGATSSAGTGPSGDHTTGTGKYVYGEASYGSSGAIAYTQSPCIDITSMAAPKLEFWYHMYGAAVSTFTVQMWYGGAWVDIWSKTGNQGNVWKKASINITPYKCVTQFRFKTKKGTSLASDIAFDDVKVYQAPPNDAGITSLNTPTTPAFSGTLPVKVGISNYGSTNLTSVNVGWSVNGVNQTTFSWAGTLAPYTSADSIQIGTYAFTAGSPTLKFWTSNPNGVADTLNANDTITTSIIVCDGYLHGNYTVGTPTSDFSDIGAAVAALNNCGIDSAVVFNIAACTYTGQLTFNSINGASASNTITFKGQGAATVIQRNTYSSNRDVIRFNGGKHIILDSLTITATGTTAYATAIRVRSGSDSNIVRNCNISVRYASYSTINCVLFSNSYTSSNSASNASHWTFENNVISGGYKAITFYGSSSYVTGNKVIGNEIKGFRYYGIYSYYQQGMVIQDNYIHGNKYSSGYGIYLNRNRDGVRVERNRLYLTGSTSIHGLYLYYMNYSSPAADTSIVANNMIYLGNATSSSYGLYTYQSSRVKILYNSVNVKSSSTYSRSYYQSSGSGLVLLNNIFANTGSGYAYFVYSPAAIDVSDYNDLYAAGSKFAYWSGDKANLAVLQNASGKDSNSVSANPQFVSNSDLHAGGVALFQAGLPLNDITTDYDGQLRDTVNSCIGADEFLIAANDAGVLSLIAPLSTCAGSTESIIVFIKNYGIDTLQSVTVNWKVDGVTQTPFSYTGSLLYGETDTAIVGTYSFSSGVAHTMDFWTTSPNNALDSINSNDSLSITNFKTGLAAGTYTIGGASANYPTFSAAVADLNNQGVCGPVVFNVNAGTYAEHFELNDIIGSSSTNTVTFKSANNDSTTVIVSYGAVGVSDNYVVKLNGTENVTFKGINFKATGSSYARVFVLGNRTGNVKFENNIIETTHNALSETSKMHLIYATDSVVGYVSIKNNVLTNGENAIDLLAAIDTIAWEIIGNDIEGHYAKGIHLRKAMSPTIVGNTIYQDTAHSAGFYYGMFFEGNTGSPVITDNKVRSTMSPRSYGIRMNYCPYSASPRGRIVNNFFQMYSNNSTLTTSSGLLIVSAPNLDIYYNNIQMTGSNVQSTALYLYKAATDSIIFKNNNLTNNAGGYAFYTNLTPYANFTNDYNNLYTYSSTKFAKMLNVEYADLAAYKTATGGGTNSVSYNPFFVGAKDLHISNNLLNGTATPISWITADIDGDVRNATTPDIGADEFDPSSIDLSVLSIVGPQSGCGLDSNEVVSVLIKNTGGDTIKGNFTVSYKWSSLANAVVETIVDTIVPGDTLLYSFATTADFDVSGIGNNVVFDLKAWTVVSGDIFHLNDTAYSNVNSYYKPVSPVVTNVTSNYGTTANLTATSSNIIWWFNSDTATVPVGIGTSYQTPVLYDTTHYWVSAHTSDCSSDPVIASVNVVGYPSVDAGITSVVWPITSVVSNTTQILQVAMHNYGTSNLTSSKIFWEINGQLDSISWTGSLAFNNVDTVNIDTTSFAGGVYNLRSWTSNPNNVTDTVNANDTSATVTFNACLSGVYTIGDTTGGAVYDFPSFVAARNAMVSAGICGPVTFQVDSGSYQERFMLPSINGAGPNARITFTSLSGDSTDVKLHYTLSSTAAWGMKITGSYYTFSHMTLSVLNSSNYGRVMEIANGSHNNEFLNCVIEGTVVNSSSNTYAVIYSNGGANQYNTFKNNLILNGSYSMYLYGSSSNLQYNNVIENNRMMNFYYYGAYLSYQKNIQFNSNYIENSASSNYIYGVRFYNADFTTATKNIINLSAAASHYGMYVYYSDGNAQARNLFANNFITLHGTGSGSWYGVYCYNSKYTNFYHNSINIAGGSNYSRAIYVGSGNNIKIVNNIFANTGAGYAYYITTPAAVVVSNYNDYYTVGSKFAYWYGDKNSLAALQTANGKDAHSLSSDPMFVAADDLHVGGVDINNSGLHLSEVADDIDGDIRNTTTPDIGADEFTPPANDAGLTNVDYPSSPVTVGANNVLLSLRNFGADTLVSASIAWSMNNVAQTTYTWSGNLPSGATKDSINIGSYTFTGGPNYLKAWSTNPNNQIDGNNTNDTITMTLIGCVSPMHGTYTIGGSTADFLSIGDAIMQLATCGVDSHVVFNINPGTYNEQMMIAPITGAADTATVTFQSSTSDSTDVTISYSAAQTNNYVVFLNGADWIRIRNITIEATNNSGKALVLNNGATHNIVFGNIIKALPSTSTSSAAIYSSDGVDSYNTFMHNDILNGYYGVYLKSASSSVPEVGIVFKYNNIVGYHYYGAYFYYLNNVVFDHNKMNNASTTTYGYALYLYHVNGAIQISNNIIDVRPMSANYGVRLYYCNANSGNHGKIFNNFIGITSGTGSSYGLYMFNSKYQDVANNNVLIKGGSSYGRALYVSSGNGNRLLNNNFIMDGPGYAYYIGSSTSVATSNYNNIYSTGAKFAYWGGDKANLAALHSASGKDGNSISVDPSYMSKYDLHVTSVSLNAKATPIAWVTTDIDGALRDTIVPDIGADEFTPLQWDAAVVHFNSPKGTYSAQGTSQTVYARIRNFGTDTITSMNVGYQYANGNVVTQAWTGFLLPGDTSSVLFTTGFTTQIGTKVLSAFTILPLDGDSSNDTLSMNYAGLPLIAPTYCDDFDGQNIWATPGSQWQRGTPQGSSINTPHSAPNVWMTRLSGNYSNNANEYLLSPFIDFSGVTNGSTLKFWRNNKFANNDGFGVEYSTDGGSTWINLGYIGDTLGTNWYNGQTGGNHMFTGNSSGWTQSTYNLSQFNQATNAIQFRFHLLSNTSGTDEGVAIDDFCIELPPIPNDVGVISIDAPVDSTQIGQNNTVTITVKNFGTATQTSIPVSYKIGSSTAINGTMTIANGLAPDSVAQYTFTQQFQSPSNDYTLCAFTSLAGDIYTSNDQVCENIKATAAALDAGVGLILAPNDTAPLWVPNAVTVRIFNYGSTPMSTCDVMYYINVPSNSVTETWTGTALAMGDSVDFTFTQKFNSPVGFYQVCAKTLLVNDADPSNDQICKTSLADGFDEHLENGMKLWQNTPNPAHGVTIINYEIPSAGQIRFELVDVLGQSVMLVEEKQQVGRHQISVDASKLATGIYYYTIEFNGYRLTKKMMVAR